eukprot:274998_1
MEENKANDNATDQNNQQDSVISWINNTDPNPNNDDRVLKAPKATRFIFFLAVKAISDGNYSFNPYGTEEHYPFYIIDQKRCAYLCIYQDRNANDIKYDLMFQIASQTFEGSAQQSK